MPARGKPRLEGLVGAPIGRSGNVCTRHHADRGLATEETRGFLVLDIGTDITHMRKGEADDLAGIGRVGQDFLVARHRRVEAQLSNGLALCARALSVEDAAIRKHDYARGFATGGLLFGRYRHICALLGIQGRPSYIGSARIGRDVMQRGVKRQETGRVENSNKIKAMSAT